jgi:type I site-specific restriction endonuclease
MKMTTEELIEEMRPLSLELEYADEAREAKTSTERVADDAAQTEETAEHHTKKELILGLYEQGTTDIAEIVRRVKARPSYVAQVLQHAGHLDGYFDLYTTTGREQNVYTRYFRNVLAFRNAEAARESVQRIDRLYNYFERLGDRAGQHQAMVMALTGKNRARWSGKLEESEVFSEWLAAH